MKKYSLFVLLPLLLVGCKNSSDTPATGSGAYKKWSYIVPVQAPSVAMAKFANLDNFETTNQPGNIPAYMAASKYDVVVAPTNVGVNAIKNKQAPYKLLATITFGNFYIASTGHDNDGVMDADDYIVSFQQNGVPDKVFHYVYKTGLDSAIKHYFASNLDVQSCLETGKDDVNDVDYVVIAEPSLTLGLKNNSNAEIYEDLQSKYKLKSGGLMLTQASIFVKKSLKKEDVKNEFLPLLKSSIEGYLAKPSTLKDDMKKVDAASTIFGVQPEVAEEVTKNGNRMGLGIKESSAIFADTNKFLEIIGSPQITNEDIA